LKSFLNEVVAQQSQTESISNLIFLVPSKRAGLFLKRELLHFYSNQTIFVPEILSIEEFITRVSGLQQIDAIQTLFEFYETYLTVFPGQVKEDFETFSTWAQTLIYDFNEIDRYCIDHKSFFTYLSGIQDLNHWYLQKEKTELIKNYIKFWENLLEYYVGFIERLLSKKIGYQGLLYRQASKNIHDYLNNEKRKHVFVGFNALNNAEQHIFQTILEANQAEIYWDSDHFFMGNAYHEAALFLRTYKKKWGYYQQHDFNWINDNFSSQKDIKLIGVPKNIGQAKSIGKILKTISVSNIKKTQPTLNSLPNSIESVNITMGLPLKHVPISSFFEMLFNLHKNSHSRGLHYKSVIEVLNSHITNRILGNTSRQLITTISRENIVYISIDRLTKNINTHAKEVLTIFFEPWKDVILALENCKKIIQLYKTSLDKKKNPLELEYAYHFHLVFNKLTTLHNTYQYVTSITTLHTLYKDLLSTESLDFSGEPFQYNLPTYKEKDAIYTYHFYRLLQRAKNIYLLYNTEDEGVGGGEQSRFLQQLNIDKRPNHKISKYTVTSEVPKLIHEPLQIEKTEDVIQKLKALATHGLSPSALTSYIRNPIDFYYKYILDIKETNQVEETIAANTLGTVIHNTLETFYKPLQGVYLTLEIIQKMKLNIQETLVHEFKKEYSTLDITQGKNLLIFEVAKRYLHNFLTSEENILQQGNSIKIIAIENNLKTKLQFPEFDFPIYIKGKVDRIDELDGITRVIDYKTGKVGKGEVLLMDWEEITQDYKYSKAMQVLCYGYMQYREHPILEGYQAGIISFKNLGEGFLKFGTKESIRSKPNYEINNQVFDAYVLQLKKLILEIFDPTIPFTEKEV